MNSAQKLRRKRFLLYFIILAVFLAAACRNPAGGPPPPNQPAPNPPSAQKPPAPNLPVEDQKQAEKDAVKSQLSYLIEGAENLLIEFESCEVSADGSDIYKDTYWISAGQIQDLKTAIDEAINAAGNNSLTLDDLKKALDAVDAIYKTAEKAKKFGTFTADKKYLQEQIDAAEAKMTGVIISGKNGDDVKYSNYWVTQAMMTALNAALDTAQTLNGNDLARQNDVDAAANNLAAAIKDFDKQEGKLIPGAVDGVTFEGPGDETINLPGNTSLSWANNEKLTVTVTEIFNSYQWIVDGVKIPGAAENSITLNARDYSIGAHTLTLKVVKGGVPYTKTLTFKVN